MTRALKAGKDGEFFRRNRAGDRQGAQGRRDGLSSTSSPWKAQPEKIPTLKARLPRRRDTVTAANSSSISDGAAAMVVMRRSEAEKRGLEPLAAILGHSTYAGLPGKFPSAPVGAIRTLLDKVGWRAGDVDLWEVNEAFAVVAMISMREIGVPHDQINVHGGACALGHPIGASGARIMVTLLGALKKYGRKKGVASLSIGGGEAHGHRAGGRMIATEEQATIRDMARRFAEEKLAPNAARWDREHAFPREAVEETGALGFMGMTVRGVGLARPTTSPTHCRDRDRRRLRCGLDHHERAQRRRLHADFDLRRRRAEGALFEADGARRKDRLLLLHGTGAGSDAASIRTRARRDGNSSYVISG